MSYMRRIGAHATAFPGIISEPIIRHRPDLGDDDVSAVSGVTFPGNKHTGMPGAAIQRRAMALADITGAEITMTRGEHYGQAYASSTGRTWSIAPAAHSTHHVPDGMGRGWEVTVSNLDGIIGWQHARYHFRTWPAVLAFMRAEFPHDAETVHNGELVDEVNAVFLDGFGETVGDLSDGDPVWAGITELDGEWFGREQNDYGQSVTYRFGNERQARDWLRAREIDVEIGL